MTLLGTVGDLVAPGLNQETRKSGVEMRRGEDFAIQVLNWRRQRGHTAELNRKIGDDDRFGGSARGQ